MSAQASWASAHGDRARLHAPWRRDDPRVRLAALLPETELGLGERFVLWIGDRWRYRPGYGWMHWDGRVWTLDEHGHRVRAGMQQVVRAIGDLEAPVLRGTSGDGRRLPARERRRHWGLACESPRRIQAGLESAECLPGVIVEEDHWDADPYAVNTLSGLLELRSGRVRPTAPEDYCTAVVQAEYDPAARSPTLDAVVAHLAGGDPAVAGFLSRWFGYCLTGSMACEVFTFLSGAAASGKSTLLSAVVSTMGSYADTASPDVFVARHASGGPTPELMRLTGKRFIHVPEAGGLRLDVPRLKQLVGGDPMVARYLHQNPVTFRPRCKLMFTANDLAVVPDNDLGLRRRLLPLRVQTSAPRQDSGVKRRLEEPEARAALLAFAVAGARLWLSDGGDLAALAAPAAVTHHLTDYMREMDPLHDWWEERVAVVPGSWALTSVLHSDYAAWSRDHGQRPVGVKTFAQRLTAKGFSVDPDRTLGSRRSGLCLNQPS